MPSSTRDCIDQRDTRTEGSAMASDRGGIYQHPRTKQVHPPTEIQLLTKKGNTRRKATELTKHIVANEYARRRHRERVTHGIVLLLVALARVDYIDEAARTVSIETDVLQHTRVLPLDEFRADHGRIRAECLFHEECDRIGPQRDIVMQDEEEAV